MSTRVAPMIGASASVSGTMAAAIRFAFVQGSFLSFSRGDADAAAKVPALSLWRALRNGRVLAFLAVWFGVNIIFGVGSIAIGIEGASVAWQAHIGGFVAGLLLFSLFDPVPRTNGDAAAASSTDTVEPRLSSVVAVRLRTGRFIHHRCCDRTTASRAGRKAEPPSAPETKPAQDCCLKTREETGTRLARGAIGFREATMTVRAILDTKGHQIESVQPGAKLSAAVKILGEKQDRRRAGDEHGRPHRRHPVGARHRARARRARRRRAG